MGHLVVEYKLPAGFVAQREALGGEFSATLGGRKVTAHLPRCRGDEPVLVRPEVFDAFLDAEPHYTDGSDPEHDDRPESPWGYAVTWGPGADEVWMVAAVAFAVDGIAESESSDVKNELTRALPEWFSAFKDWCEVVMHQDLDHTAPRRRFWVQGQEWSAWYDGEAQRIGVNIGWDSDYGMPLTEAGLSRLLEVAPTGRPATEHLLLRDARGEFARDRYRRAAIDAAVALEIGLYRLLEAMYYESPTPLGAELLKVARSWTLGTLIAKVRELVPSAAPSLNTDLARIRNGVVHKQAQEPTEEEARTVLDSASRIVTLANPIEILN